MKKRRKKIAALGLAGIMTAGMLAGCGSTGNDEQQSQSAENAQSTSQESASSAESSEDVDEEPIEIEWLLYDCYAQPDPESEIVKNVEERFNVKFKFWFVDDQKWEEVLGARLASGEMPDIMRIKNTSNIPLYVKQGILAPITDEIKAKIPETMKVLDQLDADGTGFIDTYYEGQQYALKNPTVTGEYPTNLVWRKDWLTTLGLEMPSTIEELETVLYAVRDNDPDGNGAKDTYGLSNTALNAVFGAYGAIPMKEFRGTGAQSLFYTMKDGKIAFACIQPEMKEALTKLQEWYKEGFIDPEFVTGENTGGYWAVSQAFNNDKLAVTGMIMGNHWIPAESESIAAGPCYTEFEALHPDMVWAETVDMGPAIVGPDGKSGTHCWGVFSNSGYGITTQCVNDPRKLEAVCTIMEVMTTDNDLYRMCRDGIEGVDWEYDDEGMTQGIGEWTPADNNKKGKQVFSNAGCNYEMLKAAYRPFLMDFFEKYKTTGYSDILVPTTDAANEYLTDLKTFTLDAYIKFITGEESIDKFDDFVEQFNSLGGRQIVDEINELVGFN